MYLEMISRADPSLMMVVGLQAGAADDIEKYGSEEVKRDLAAALQRRARCRAAWT